MRSPIGVVRSVEGQWCGLGGGVSYAILEEGQLQLSGEGRGLEESSPLYRALEINTNVPGKRWITAFCPMDSKCFCRRAHWVDFPDLSRPSRRMRRPR